MAQIKKLTLKLKSGLLSELQSDTVMGHFCWRLKDRFDNEVLEKFIKLYWNDNPVFTISNVLLEKDYWDEKRREIIRTELFFPKPFIHIKEIGSKPKNKKDKMIEFLINKKLKSVELLTIEQFNLAINGKVNELYESIMTDELPRPKFESDLKVSVEIDRNSFSAREGQLFSYHPKFLDEDTRVVFLLKVIDEKAFTEFKCAEILKNVFELGFGRKKSSGYGQFEIISDLKDFDKIDEPIEFLNGFITLGNYLPSAADVINKNCNYDFIVKYGRLGEEKSISENPFKKPIILFTPGSVFKTVNIKEFYGRITQNG